MDEPIQVATSLAKRVVAIPDVAMRVAYVRHELSRMAPELVADVVAIAANLNETRIPPNPQLLLSISLALADESANEVRRAALGVAASRGQHDVVLLLGRRLKGGDGPDAEEEDERQIPDFGAGRPLTLGERKSLARKRDRDLIMRVLRDPHADVIEILLGNPAVTEDDVVRLAARRPVPATILRKVFRSTRWIVRYRIQRALCLNPHTPLDVSLSLVRHLTAMDRKLVRESTTLPEELRRASADEKARDLH